MTHDDQLIMTTLKAMREDLQSARQRVTALECELAYQKGMLDGLLHRTDNLSAVAEAARSFVAGTATRDRLVEALASIGGADD